MRDARLFQYFRLTKPSIVVLVVVTGGATMAAEGSLFVNPWLCALILLAIVLSAGSANALNQYIDRDIDAIMDRTRTRRPLPQNKLKPFEALVFGISLGVLANLYLWWKTNEIAAIISVATILFYVVIYTLWLKRRHYYNIVIGGAAGATAPLIASAAIAGEPSLLSWIFFLVIFFWTPPHFWALALAIKPEYEKVRVPMLPNIKGDQRTRTEIFWYTLLLLPLTLAPYFLGSLGLFFLISSTLLWGWYVYKTVVLLKTHQIGSYKRLFLVSIAYLFFLFGAASFDGALRHFYGA